jgi:hypothetical protein
MMLGTLLDRLGTFLSKYFIIGSFVPVLMFTSVNIGLLYWSVPSFRRLTGDLTSSTESIAYVSGVAAVGLAVTAYILSSANTVLRETLEGKRLKVLLRASLFESRQRNKRDLLDENHKKAKNSRKIIQQKRESWTTTLTSAKAKRKNHAATILNYSSDSEAKKQITRLGKQLGSGEDCSPTDIDNAVQALAAELEKEIGEGAKGKIDLESDHEYLLSIIDTAIDQFSAKEVNEFNKKLFFFGDADVAPTTMGNVALSIENYAYTRYGLNLAHFWSRFQPVIQNHKDFYAGLLDAKTQVEFLVACFWLSCLTTSTWMVLLAFKTYDLFPFLLIALAGPLLTVAFYRLAVTGYIVFADLVRTSVDLYRLELFTSLHIAPPNSVREERAKWKVLEIVSAAGQREQELSYQSKADTK